MKMIYNIVLLILMSILLGCDTTRETEVEPSKTGSTKLTTLRAYARCKGRTSGGRYDLMKFNEPTYKYIKLREERGWLVTFIGKKEFPEDQFSVWFGEKHRFGFMIHGDYKFPQSPAGDSLKAAPQE